MHSVSLQLRELINYGRVRQFPLCQRTPERLDQVKFGDPYSIGSLGNFVGCGTVFESVPQFFLPTM